MGWERVYFDDMSSFSVRMIAVRGKSLGILCVTAICTVEAACKFFRR